MSAHGLEQFQDAAQRRGAGLGPDAPVRLLATISRQQALDARAAAGRDAIDPGGNGHWQTAERAFANAERALAEGRIMDAAGDYGSAAGAFLRARRTAPALLPVAAPQPAQARRGLLPIALAIASMVAGAAWALQAGAPRPRPRLTVPPPTPSPMSMLPLAMEAPLLDPPSSAPAPPAVPQPPTPVTLQADTPPTVADPLLREWLARYVTAWQQRDTVALQRLGVLTSAQESPRLDAELARDDTLRIAIRNLQVRRAGRIIVVSFDRQILHGDGSAVGDVLRYQLRRSATGLVGVTLGPRG